MSTSCGAVHSQVRWALWLALLLNAGMFALEIWQGLAADSVSLLADAIDFLGDAANYGISLYVLTRHLHLRARASLLKAVSMLVFAAFVLGHAIHHALTQPLPESFTMGWVGLLALAVNVTCALLLYRTRGADSNLRSVWLCSRNDAIGNLAVLLAAILVFWSGTVWPDLAAALFIAALATRSAFQIIRQARGELRTR